MEDWDLIQEYTEKDSQEAFEKITQKYGSMVYSTCLRMLGDHHLAEEAGQAVFITLAQKIGSFGRNVMLPIWLYRTARFAVKELKRTMRRQQKQKEQLEPASDKSINEQWSTIRPHIDEALAVLGKGQKEAVILHYIQGLSQKEIAEMTGCGEDAVHKKIKRGLEKLKARLSARGVAFSVTVLSGIMMHGFAEAAPAGIMAGFFQAGAASAAGQSIAGSMPLIISKGVMKMMFLAKVKAALIAVLISVVCIGGTGAVLTGLDNKPAEQKQVIVFLDADKNVKVNIKEGTVEIPARSNITKSLVEVALCSLSAPSNKSHESSFVTDCRPSIIHAGLAMIGLKPGKPVAFEGEDRIPSGDGVYIYVRWKDGKTGKENLYRLEDLIYNYHTKEPLFRFKWIFTGSRIVKGKEREYYEADEEGTIIATWHVSAAVIDIPLPEGSDDTAFYAYGKKMPPAKTDVSIIFSKNELKTAAAGLEKPEKSRSAVKTDIPEDIAKQIGAAHLKDREYFFFDSIFEWDIKPADKAAEMFIQQYSGIFPQRLAEYIVYRAEVEKNKTDAVVKIVPLWCWRVGGDTELVFIEEERSEEVGRQPLISMPGAGDYEITTDSVQMKVNQSIAINPASDYSPVISYLGLPEHVRPVFLKWLGFKSLQVYKGLDKEDQILLKISDSGFNRYFRNIVNMDTQVLGMDVNVSFSFKADGKGESDITWKQGKGYPETTDSRWDFNLVLQARFDNAPAPADPDTGVKVKLAMKRRTAILDHSMLQFDWPKDVPDLFSMMKANRLEYWKKVQVGGKAADQLKQVANTFVLDMEGKQKIEWIRNGVKNCPWANKMD